MKKTIKIFICLLLIVSVVLSLASCEMLDIAVMAVYGAISNLKSNDNDGYTGGLHGVPRHYYYYREIHWIETFDEAITAIEHLRAAGNDIPNVYISGYENESVDAKYIFIVDTHDTPKQKDGEEWYDRKFERVEQIEYYGFLEKVSIEEIEYSRIDDYKCVSLGSSEHEDDHTQPQHIYYECEKKTNSYDDSEKFYEICRLIDGTNDSRLATLSYIKVEDHNAELPQYFHREFVWSLIYIGD